MTALFGPAGASNSFYEQGYKSSLEMCSWLESLGLDAFEYQCTRGVVTKEELGRKIGEQAKKHHIRLSIHAPYYISISSPEEEKRLKSIDYIIQTMVLADYMGADRIVVHSGSCAKISRQQAMEFAKVTLIDAQKAADALGLCNIHICPETMGKINQLGDLDEVLELCLCDERFIPTIDFGHLHTRTLGGLKTRKDFRDVFDQIENKLGYDRLKYIHAHYSRIEFTKGGEKKHWHYNDTQHGPNFEPIAELIYQKNLCPVIICESAGTQAEDAQVLKALYLQNGSEFVYI